MLSQRTVVPPGFTELASDAELAAQLGTATFGALIRLCHLAAPAADVPGGWCTTMGAEDLAAALGVSRKTAAKWLGDLVAAGLLARIDGRPLGRGLGSTPTRYFLTAIAGLTHPGPIGPGTSSRGKASPGKDARVIPYPVQPAQPSPGHRTARAKAPTPVVDVSSLHTDPNEAAVPSWLTRALNDIGYVGPLPPGTLNQHEPAVLLRVIEQIRARDTISNPAAYLNWLLRAGPSAVTDFLADAPQAEPDRMDLDEYLRLRGAFPAWDHHVQRLAATKAAETGVNLDLKVILQVAAVVDVADVPDAGAVRREAT